MFLRGLCPYQVVPVLLGANLTALVKKSGGIRPVAVGYFWRRLCVKCANYFASNKLAAYFESIPLRVDVFSVCEATVHACRRYT